MPGPGWQAGPSHPTAAAGVTAVTAVRQRSGWARPQQGLGQRPQPDASWVILLWNLFTVGSLRSTASADIPPSPLPPTGLSCWCGTYGHAGLAVSPTL